MSKEMIFSIGSVLREILNDIVNDVYDEDSNLAQEEKTDFIVNFLIKKNVYEKYYFDRYEQIDNSKIYYYKKLIVGILITDFYEYQTIMKERGRQSSEFTNHYNFIENNLNKPELIFKYFFTNIEPDFNKALIDNYIIYNDENKPFIAKAINRQIDKKNVLKLNKINPYYITGIMSFKNNINITEIDNISDEIMQIYYDEFSKYFAVFEKEEVEEESEIEDEDYDEIENMELDDIDSDEMEELFYSHQNEEYINENKLSMTEEDIITRLTKLRIIQKYIIEGPEKLFDVIGYIIGNVYENILYDDNMLSTISLLKEEIYTIIEEKESAEELINCFIVDDDFSTIVINCFVEYNEYSDKELFRQKREFIEENNLQQKVKVLNKFYDEENKNFNNL